MEKKRLYYLDYIRAFSTILIILTHYNALFLYLPEPYVGPGIILTAYVNQLYIGDWGVSLFLIISGAALMYTYKDNFNLIYFYKKRILTIFPVYWFTYIVVMSYLFLKYKTINPSGAEPWKIILSLIGMDAYFGTVTSIWAYIGEWFLGLIIILYLIFPILRWLINKYECLLWLFTLVGFLIALKFNPDPLPPALNIFVRLPEFLFGMSFIKHEKKIMNCKTAVICAIILCIDWNNRAGLSVSFRTTYMGIITFIIIVSVSKYFEKIRPVNRTCAWICKYSYIIFLIHHRVIWEVTGNWDMAEVTGFQSCFLFLICLEIIFLSAFLLKRLYDNINIFARGFYPH